MPSPLPNPPSACAARVGVNGYTPANQPDHDTCGPAALANLWQFLGYGTRDIPTLVNAGCYGMTTGAASVANALYALFLPGSFEVIRTSDWAGTWGIVLQACANAQFGVPNTSWEYSCAEHQPGGADQWARLKGLVDSGQGFVAQVWNGDANTSPCDGLHWVAVIGYTEFPVRKVRYVSYGEVLEVPWEGADACAGFMGGFQGMWANDRGVNIVTSIGSPVGACHYSALYARSPIQVDCSRQTLIGSQIGSSPVICEPNQRCVVSGSGFACMDCGDYNGACCPSTVYAVGGASRSNRQCRDGAWGWTTCLPPTSDSAWGRCATCGGSGDRVCTAANGLGHNGCRPGLVAISGMCRQFPTSDVCDPVADANRRICRGNDIYSCQGPFNVGEGGTQVSLWRRSGQCPSDTLCTTQGPDRTQICRASECNTTDAPRCMVDQSGVEACGSLANINVWLPRSVCRDGALCLPGENKCTFEDECVSDVSALCGTHWVCEGNLQKSCSGRRDAEDGFGSYWAPARTVWRYEPCPPNTRCEQFTVSCNTSTRCVALPPSACGRESVEYQTYSNFVSLGNQQYSFDGSCVAPPPRECGTSGGAWTLRAGSAEPFTGRIITAPDRESALIYANADYRRPRGSCYYDCVCGEPAIP